MEYREEDYLMLSGIQHFEFCKRQWCLIHIEQLWDENLRTTEGKLMHENAHDPFFSEKRKDVIISRAMPIHSRRMGVSGECDIVEFRKSKDGVFLHGRDGKYSVYPIEYKKGKPKDNDADIVQLTAQIMCLEEMFLTEIREGAIYYGETRSRLKIAVTDEMKNKVESMFREMHLLIEKGYTVQAKTTKSCNACSLKEVCLPKLAKNADAQKYNQLILLGEDE